MLTNTEREVVKEAMGIVARETAAGEKVILKGFGTFSVKEKAARTARNPQTGEAVQVPAKSVLTFKASPSMIEFK
jgi:nucleoid DNA-binding protein